MKRRTFLWTSAGLGTAMGRTARVAAVDPPAGAGSGMPNFSTAAGRTLLSWLEPAGGGAHALRFAEWKGGAWKPAVTVATGANWFVNWADFPSVIATPQGAVFAHWLERMGRGTYGYGIRVARAAETDGPWSQAFTAKPADEQDYSGFLSFALTPSGPAAAYLAAPDVPTAAPAAHHGHEEDHRKTLRVVKFGWDGSVRSDAEVDPSVCSCCPTATISTPSGLMVAYRDRLEREIRDISVVRESGGGWTEPQRIHADGWKINGCPTEGPSMAADGDRAGVAWLTRAGDRPMVQAAWSRGRAPFGPPVRVDDGDPLGRPSVTFADGKLLVAWIEKTGSAAELRLKRLGSEGGAEPAVRLAAVAAARSTGIPRIAVAEGRRLLFAWREERVRVGSLRLSDL